MLIRTIANFKLVDVNTTFATIEQHIADAEAQFVKPLLGTAQYDALDDAITNNNPTAEETALLEVIYPAIRHLAMYIGLPKMNIRFNDLGAMKSESADFSNASGGEVYFARIQFLLDGYKALDSLLAFLEENKADYSDWTGSSAYTQFKAYFINTATLFTQHSGAPLNRWLFTRLVPVMNMVETLQIARAIGGDYLTLLKTAWATDDTSNDENTLIEKLRKPIALYTYARGLKDPTIRELVRVCSATTADELSNKGTTSNDYSALYNQLAQQLMAEADALLADAKAWLNTQASDSLFSTYFNSDYYSEPPSTPTILPEYNNGTSTSSFSMV